MYTRLIVPLDGSELAQQALPQATMLAQRGALPLHLVRVVDPLPLGRLAIDAVAEATADLAQTAARLRTQGLTVTTEVRQGAVVDELLRGAQPGARLATTSLTHICSQGWQSTA